MTLEAGAAGALGAALLLAMGASFWGLATVCENYFVPALNLLCDLWRIPDDVAGATLMAAGASSPELFTSLIALFVTRSEVGLGTVIGSEIFNHLGICAGSTLYARKRTWFGAGWKPPPRPRHGASGETHRTLREGIC